VERAGKQKEISDIREPDFKESGGIKVIELVNDFRKRGGANKLLQTTNLSGEHVTGAIRESNAAETSWFVDEAEGKSDVWECRGQKLLESG